MLISIVKGFLGIFTALLMATVMTSHASAQVNRAPVSKVYRKLVKDIKKQQKQNQRVQRREARQIARKNKHHVEH